MILKDRLTSDIRDMLRHQVKIWSEEDAILIHELLKAVDMSYMVDYIINTRELKEDIVLYSVGLNGHFSGRHSRYLMWLRESDDYKSKNPFRHQDGEPFYDWPDALDHAVERYFALMIRITHQPK